MQGCFLFKRSQIIFRNQQGFLELVKFSTELATLGGEPGCFLPPVSVGTIIGIVARGKLSTYLCGLLIFNLEMSPQCFTLSYT